MRYPTIIFATTFSLWCGGAVSQTATEIQNIADTMVRLCVGGGSTQASTVGGEAGADISLRSLDVTGKLKTQFTVSKSRAEGLVNGLDNAISKITAEQADKVRICLEPVRTRILDILLPVNQKTQRMQVSFDICEGEKRERCPASHVYSDCYRVNSKADELCRSVDRKLNLAKQISSASGNRCGYSMWKVICE